jgi:hypothetical protein
VVVVVVVGGALGVVPVPVLVPELPVPVVVVPVVVFDAGNTII